MNRFMSRAPEPAQLILIAQNERKPATLPSLLCCNIMSSTHYKANVQISRSVSNSTSWSDYASGLYWCGQREINSLL